MPCMHSEPHTIHVQVERRLEPVLLAYAALWSEADHARRASLLTQCLARDAEIVALRAMVDGVA